MKLSQISKLFILVCVFFHCSCNDEPSPEKNEIEQKQQATAIKEEYISFTSDTMTSRSYVAYDENKKGTRPVVLVIHEWWGLNDFIKTKARQLAELGYLSVAVDMFGNGKTADNPVDAEAMALPFYMDPKMTLIRVQAALAKAKNLPQADTTQVAAIGYCFGGGILLNTARLGLDVDGIVSFHGSLLGTPANKELLKAKILVCHGAADPFVPEQEVLGFKKSMDSINAGYTFKAYQGAMHAFTNPNATETGKKFNIPIAYNAAADSKSWTDMKAFFAELFSTN